MSGDVQNPGVFLQADASFTVMLAPSYENK